MPINVVFMFLMINYIIAFSYIFALIKSYKFKEVNEVFATILLVSWYDLLRSAFKVIKILESPLKEFCACLSFHPFRLAFFFGVCLSTGWALKQGYEFRKECRNYIQFSKAFHKFLFKINHLGLSNQATVLQSYCGLLFHSTPLWNCFPIRNQSS